MFSGSIRYYKVFSIDSIVAAGDDYIWHFEGLPSLAD